MGENLGKWVWAWEGVSKIKSNGWLCCPVTRMDVYTNARLCKCKPHASSHAHVVVVEIYLCLETNKRW